MDAATATDDAIRVYWMTGCTSCLRTKEFLARHRVPFLSRNVLEDASAYDELARFGLRRVPIVTKGDTYADGQVLRDVAQLVGVDMGAPQVLPVGELRNRQEAILAAALRYAAQLPADTLATLLPGRPRSHADLVFHIFNIADAFLEHERGIPLVFESYFRLPAPDAQDRTALIAYGQKIRDGMQAWFSGPGRGRDWTATADVYYGAQTMHEFLERTVWHSGQHTRQLMWVLEGLGIAPDGPLDAATFKGLPMPEEVWG